MDTIFKKAARSALNEWKQSIDGLDDLASSIWVWYLERPMTQRKLGEIEEHEAVKTVKKAALQMLRQNTLDDNLFDGKNLYSSESVKDYLSGTSTNEYLAEIMPEAVEALEQQNDGKYAEALHRRYSDHQIPRSKSEENVLVRAHQSLTEHVNLIAVKNTVDVSGVGSRDAVFEHTRKAKGGHPDPTGDIALSLLDKPVERHHYLEPTDKDDFLGGAGASVVLELGGGKRYRATGYEARMLKKHPDLVGPFTEKVRQRC
jgi:hypothetical protein